MKKLAFCLWVLITMGCSVSPDYYPRGTVEIKSYLIFDQLGSRYSTIFYSVSNTGISKISSVTISLYIQTDRGDYYKTLVNSISIQPNHSIFGDTTISFVTNNSRITHLSNILIKNAFFE